MNGRNLGRTLGALAVPLGVVAIIMLLVVPVPTWLLDVLITVNILFALVILLTTMFARRPLDFSVFPSLLLVATLLRLGLNVASTRLVLSDGYAGAVIQAFGHVAIGGSLIIGAVIFLILVVIQFVVVTKGAERVAEVGARFTLDAMPGKQMAIDADLNAGLITEDEARARRADVSAEADFYGAMDGASKFVKGDAIAGIIIIVINLLGGIAIGVLSHGQSIEDAIQTYSLLTIGDGLATQIPALLMAVATGMIVTRSNSESDMATDSWKQLSQSSKGLLIAGIAAIGLALVPGMPPLTFLLIGGGLILASRAVTRKQKADAVAAVAAEGQAALGPSADTPEELMEQMRVHALEVQLAPDLVDLVSGADDDLLGRVKALRRRIAMEYGVVIPPVRTRDQIDLPPATYVIRIAGAEVGRGTAPTGRVLALGEDLDSLPGETIVEPVFGLTGKWIPGELRYGAEIAGATVVDRGSMIITHLSSLIVENAARLLSREDVRVLTEGVKQVSPAVVDELIPSLLSLSEVHRALQGLLSEKVPINDLPRIYEALTLRAKVSNDPEGLVEAARVGLGPAVVAPHLVERALRVVMIDPMLEQEMLESLRPSEYGSQILFDANKAQAVLTSLQTSVTAAEQQGITPVLVCAPALRPAVRRMVSAQTGGIAVLSYNEVTSMDVAIETVGVVRAHDSIAV